MHDENDTGFPKLSAPARRALSGAGYTHLEQLAQTSESNLNGCTALDRQRYQPCALRCMNAAYRFATESG